MYPLNSRIMFGHIENAKIVIKAAKGHFEIIPAAKRHRTCAPPVVDLII
jgi:hypothetical protein